MIIIKKLIRAMLTLTMFSVLTRLLGFFYKIYMSRIMTTTELGIYNLTLSIYMVLITIVASSIPLTISKTTSINKSNNMEYKTTYSITSSLIFNFILALALVIILFISKPLLLIIVGGNLGFILILTLMPSVIFSAIYAQIRGFLWGHENYFAVSMVEFIEQILRILFCMIFVSLGIFKSPVTSVGVALSIACGLSTLYGLLLYLRKGGKFRFKKGYYKDILKSSLPLTGIRVFGSLVQPIVAIILPLQLSKLGMDKSIALGELGIIMGMSMPLLSIPSTIIGALCMILIPRISIYYENQELNNINNQIENYIQFSLICLFMFFPIFISLGIPICTYVFKNSAAGIYLSYSAWIIIPMGISQITTSILNALNEEKRSFIYYIISSIFMFIFVILLPKYIGISAMLYGLGISSIVLATLNMLKIRKLTKYTPQIISKLVIQLLICLPIILITKLCFNTLNFFMGDFLSIAISSIISVTTYLSLIFVFNIINFRNFKVFSSKSIKKSMVQ